MSKQTSSSAGNLTFIIDLGGGGCNSTINYSIVGYPNPKGASSSSSSPTFGASSPASAKPQRIYQSQRAHLIDPSDDDNGGDGVGVGSTAMLLPTSLSTVWAPLRSALGVLDKHGDSSSSSFLPTSAAAYSPPMTTTMSRNSAKVIIGAALGDAIVQDEGQALRFVKAVATAPTSGGGVGDVPPTTSAPSSSSVLSSAASREAVESLASKFKLLPLTATEIAVSEEGSVRAQLNARIAKVSSSHDDKDGGSGTAALASLAVLAPPQPSSMVIPSSSSSSAGKSPFFDISVLVLFPNDPSSVPRIAREVILSALFAINGVLLGSTSSTSSSSSPFEDLAARRFFKLPLRITKVQFAHSAVATLNATGLHSGVVCQIMTTMKSPESEQQQQSASTGVEDNTTTTTVSICAVSNAQPVLPLCSTTTFSTSSSSPARRSSRIALIAQQYISALSNEMSLDVPAIHCYSTIATNHHPNGASSVHPVNHPLAYSQNTTGIDSSSLKDLVKNFIVKGSSEAAVDEAHREFSAAYIAAAAKVGGGGGIVDPLLQLLLQDGEATATGAKRPRCEEASGDGDGDGDGEGASSFLVNSSLVTVGGGGCASTSHPKEVTALTVPTLIELVGIVSSSATASSSSTTSNPPLSQPSTPHLLSSQGQSQQHPYTEHGSSFSSSLVVRTVNSSSSIQPTDRMNVSAIVGGTVLVQLPAFETYFSVTASQYRQEGPAVSVARVPLDSR